jgi:hypothetical protein
MQMQEKYLVMSSKNGQDVKSYFGRFPTGQAFRSYCTGLSHMPVSAPILNA